MPTPVTHRDIINLLKDILQTVRAAPGAEVTFALVHTIGELELQEMYGEPITLRTLPRYSQYAPEPRLDSTGDPAGRVVAVLPG